MDSAEPCEAEHTDQYDADDISFGRHRRSSSTSLSVPVDVDRRSRSRSEPTAQRYSSTSLYGFGTVKINSGGPLPCRRTSAGLGTIPDRCIDTFQMSCTV